MDILKYKEISNVEKSHLLVVEDEIPAGEAIKEMLELNGYPVTLVNSGREAIRIVHNKGDNISAILMDIKMEAEEIDGLDATREIQQSFGVIPTILVTAYTQNRLYQQKVQDAHLKIAGWIDKPITRQTETSLMYLIREEIKKTIRSKIEDRLYRDISSYVIQYLMQELSLRYGITLLLEVIKEMDGTFNSNPISTDEVLPYLNFLAYQNMKDELEKNYPNQFVAFLDGEKIAQNPDRDELIKMVYDSFKRTDIFITKVLGEPRVIKLRRPRRAFRYI